MGTIVIQSVGDDKDWSADPTDEFDLLYVLEGVGWSRCYLYLQTKIHTFEPTHLFDSPLDVMLEGMTHFLEGENRVNFTWYDEPATHDWFVERDENRDYIMNVKIVDHDDIETDPENRRKIAVECEGFNFKVKTKIFCACLFKQVEKIEFLIKEESYRERRISDFNPQAISNYKSAFLKKYGSG